MYLLNLRVNIFSNTLKLLINAQTVRSGPTIKDVKHFQNGSVHTAYEKSIYEWNFLSEPIENHALSNELSKSF